ncbi:hypothetical protein [Actinokineospora fastidiosa]|uniref:DUF1542 domain-containing protein n=1 Tax=Actinokineospora fastidiosa TaxID=1816 RepID=A0A918LG05_9PSEU|nr:hypothetical protein [Actinokineospora fastidiosa]GGS42214.1 hypothetical protein GCM10010171_41270 [Actinokineospora fastidiosa]
MEILLVLVVALVVVGVIAARSGAGRRRAELENAQAEARRWVERLGGQVMNLTGTTKAAQQAMADASERYTAAGSQMDQATTVEQCRLVTKTALEGLYYVRAARVAMDMDPGPELPVDPEAARAGAVTEHRRVAVEGHHYAASPDASQGTPYYYPGGRVAGRSVPRGWYSEPWWRPALVAGAWGVGSMLLFSTMFAGMAGIASADAWAAGYDAGAADAGGDMGGDAGDGGDIGDPGGDMGGDPGADPGGDFGGDFGGGFGGDFGGGDFF